MPGTRRDPARIAAVLAGVANPARTWQLLVQADYYGADTYTRAVLGRLPVGVYPSVDAALAALPALRHSPAPDQHPRWW